MKKLISVFIAILFIAVACENASQKQAEQAENATEVIEVEVVPLQLAEFNTKAGDLVGKQIEFNGMIDHVCKHGGQKMFIVNENADARVKVVTGENMAAFNTEMEGESVTVIGTVDELRIDEEYLKEWEEEVMAGIGPDEGEKSEKVHMGEGEGEHHEHEENADLVQIEKYRQKIAESEKDYISFFSVVCVEYEITETETTEEGV